MGWEVMEGLRFLASLPLAGTLGRGKEARKRNLSIAYNPVSVLKYFSRFRNSFNLKLNPEKLSLGIYTLLKQGRAIVPVASVRVRPRPPRYAFGTKIN